MSSYEVVTSNGATHGVEGAAGYTIENGVLVVFDEDKKGLAAFREWESVRRLRTSTGFTLSTDDWRVLTSLVESMFGRKVSAAVHPDAK